MSNLARPLMLAAILLVVHPTTARPVDDAVTIDHALQVALDPAAHAVSVDDTLTLPAHLRARGATFTLNAALSIERSRPAVRRLGADGGIARYALEADATGGTLRLLYGGTLASAVDERADDLGSLGTHGVYLDGGSGWLPRFDDTMLRFTLAVTAPADWHVISQGDGRSGEPGVRGDGTVATWSSSTPLEQVYLVGGPLTVTRDTVGDVDVLVYLHEEDDALARRYLDATGQYIEMYEQLIGPYPYGKFALIENFWETGYGMPSFTLLGPQVIRFPFILHSSYPHEILHNWWGNSVFVDYASGNWCEGLTAYMADHLIKEQGGTGHAYRREALQKYRDYVKDGRDFPLSRFRSRHDGATQAVGYGKALMLFHMLRRRIGDDLFRAALADFYRTQRGARASFDDIRASVETVTGDEYAPYFAQWVDRAGAPRLAVRDVEVKASDPSSGTGGFTVRGTLEQVQSDEPFAVDVPVVVATEEGRHAFVVEMTDRWSSFAFETGGRPLALAVDPAFDVFRQLDARETPSSIGQIFGEPRITAVLPSGAEAAAYRRLLASWHAADHDITIVDDAQIDALPVDRAVWILGRANRFAPAVLAQDPPLQSAGQWSEADAALSLGGQDVSLADHTVVVIRRHPGNAEKAVGWISVAPQDAIPGLARKLPHYGKYSYLAFTGDAPTNTVKGQWDAADSPLVVDLGGGTTSIEPAPRAALIERAPADSRTQPPTRR
ncbi:MAG: M1 family metallopeptidase [Planctomycetota bacterium]